MWNEALAKKVKPIITSEGHTFTTHEACPVLTTSIENTAVMLMQESGCLWFILFHLHILISLLGFRKSWVLILS